MDITDVHVHFMCPAALRTRAKVHAAKTGQTMTSVIIQALNEYLKEHEEKTTNEERI